MSKKEENYNEIKKIISSDDYYKEVIRTFKKLYTVGLGDAYIQDIYLDNLRKKRIKDISLNYLDHLYEKNAIKNPEKMVEILKIESFGLFANLAFNKEMFPDASIEKYVNEAPEISQKVQKLLLSSFPEIFANYSLLEEVDHYSPMIAFKNTLANASVAKLIEHTFLIKYVEHFNNDSNFFSKQNQQFLEKGNYDFTHSFSKFPKAKKVLQKIGINLIDKMSELLLKESAEDKFNQGFKQIMKFWLNMSSIYHKEDFLEGTLKNVIERYIKDKDILEIDKFYQEIIETCKKTDEEKLLQIIENVKPNFMGSLMNKKEGLVELDDEIIYKKRFMIKERFIDQIFQNEKIKDLKNQTIFVENAFVGIDIERYYIINICTEDEIILSVGEIINIINEIYANDENNKKNIDVTDNESKFKRLLLLKNELANVKSEDKERKRAKI